MLCSILTLLKCCFYLKDLTTSSRHTYLLKPMQCIYCVHVSLQDVDSITAAVCLPCLCHFALFVIVCKYFYCHQIYSFIYLSTVYVIVWILHSCSTLCLYQRMHIVCVGGRDCSRCLGGKTQDASPEMMCSSLCFICVYCFIVFVYF